LVLTRSIAVPAVIVALSLSAAGVARAGDDKYVIDPGESVTEPLYIADFRPPTRFVIGFDFGLGVLGGLCQDCDRALGGLAVDVFSGEQITRRIAVLGDLFSVLHLLPSDEPDERGPATHTFASAAMRFWATPELWLQGGLGGAAYRVDSSQTDSHYGPAVTLSVGGEMDHHPDKTVSLAARLGFAFYDDGDGGTQTLYNIAAVVGWHWF